MPTHSRAGNAASSRPSRQRAPDLTGAAEPLRADPPALELETNALEDQLSGLLEEFGSELVVRLERKPMRYAGTEYAGGYLGSISASDGDLLEIVREKFGGGQYIGRVADGRRIRGRIQFSIAGKPKDPADDAPPASASAGELSRLERLEAVLERVVEQLGKAPAASDKDESLERFLNTAKVLRELTPAPAAAVATGSPVSILKDWLELQELLGTRGGDGDSFGSVVKEALPPLLETINKKIQQDGELLQLRRKQLERGRPVAVVEGSAHVTNSADPLAVLLADMPAYAVAYLASMAAHEKDPALYASMVLDNLPAEVVDRLPELLAGESDAVGARLVALVPAWSGYPAWFAELVRELLEAQAEQAAGDVEGQA